MRELSTTVVSCNAHQPQALPANNRKKKVVGAAADKDLLLEVVLHDTVLFPEGGGQPSDIGYLRTAEGETFDVTEVKRRGGHAIHFVRSKNGHVHGLAVGAHVAAALGEQGFKRRLDHVSLRHQQCGGCY